MPTHRVQSLEELPAVAEALVQRLGEQSIFTFTGNLGAGKTTLIQQICRQLGVEEEVDSPTFGLVNEYHSPGGPIYHFDLYRVNSVEELLDMGFLEYIDSGAPCFIEWPELAEQILNEGYYRINIAMDKDGERVIRW